MKADAWEGGHRIPFIVRWPGHVKAGGVSNLMTTLTNLISYRAELIGGTKPGMLQRQLQPAACIVGNGRIHFGAEANHQ